MNPSVVIVDDHELFRAGVRSELAAHVDVVGDADGVESAVPTILHAEPDVVLLDVHMPGGGGVEVIRQVTRVRPEQRFLALSVSDAPDDVIAVIRAGARGYVTKSISPAELADAVPADRRGVRESIVGRMARHGGSAAVHTAPGQGTEVALRLPRRP